MKLILLILLVIAFIGPAVDKEKSIGEVFKDSLINYVSSVDRTVSFLSSHSETFNEIKEFPFRNSYEDVMKDRVFVKHTVTGGENLDSIIKLYNSQIDDIDEFRKVVLYENKENVSSDYSLIVGTTILIPSDINNSL